MIERGWSVARLSFAILLFLALIGALYFFTSRSAAIAAVKGDAVEYQFARLAAPDGEIEKPRFPDQAALRTTLVANPLNAGIVNAATYGAMRGHDIADLPTDKLNLLSRLGWRDTTALQNVLYARMQQQDIDGIIDVADALLRRQKLVEQVTPVMNLLELYPETRETVAEKLAKNPPWRTLYLSSVKQLSQPQQLEGRGKLALELSELGEPLDRQELFWTLNQMVNSGDSALAYTLWLDYRGVERKPLNDPDFDWAYEMRETPYPLPFEWYLPSGNGFWGELVRSGDAAAVSFDWNGKGVPQLLMQNLWIKRGRYELVVEGSDLPATLLDQYLFALRCPNGAVVFDEVVSRSANRVVLGSDDPFACSAAVFLLSGKPDSSISGDRAFGMNASRELVVTALRLRRAS